MLHLAAAGVRAASGDPFWISTPDADHIRITTSSIDDDPARHHPDSEHPDHDHPGLTDLADLVADAARAGTWAGHR